jgi:type II secretory pathway predicted ATPase ExeA
MYYDHFGLKYPPFKITPDTQLFYSGGKRGLVLEALVYAIENGEGIVKVVGEVGSGKTMLCRMLGEKLPKRIEVVYIMNPRLPPDMILHAIALEMRLPITPQENRLQVMQTLQTRLLEKHAQNQQVVVFIEEAQEMPLETLEEIRLISNLETTRHKLLQIVLFGQPELENNLSAPNIRQLKERITHSFYLEALTRQEISEYLRFRMHAVGYRGPPIFSSSAVRLLTRVSKGLVRRVNILADKALLAAFANGVHIIRPKHIRLAARDSGFTYRRLSTGAWMSLITLVALLLVLSPYQEMAWTWLKNNATFLVPIENTSSVPVETSTAAPPNPSAAAVHSTTTASLLQQRLQATEQWIATANNKHYTIQVMQTRSDNTDNLTALLRQPEIQPLLKEIYIHRVNRKEQVFWEMLYGQFTDANSAKAAIASLPETLQRNKPFLRKIAHLN